MNAPTVTPKLVEDVFRSYQPAPTGLEFGRGLSPFAVVCQGHAGVKEVDLAFCKLQRGDSTFKTSIELNQDVPPVLVPFAIWYTDLRSKETTYGSSQSRLYCVSDVLHLD